MEMRYCVHGATIRGIEAIPVDVEVLVGPGMPGFSIVGMPDAAIQDARERVRAAIRACDFSMPASKVVVNLAPGSLKKTGSGFDLPIALGILVATGQLDPQLIDGCLCVGELSLDGYVRPVKGMLAFELSARRQGLRLLSAQPEDGLVQVEGLECQTVSTLRDLVSNHFRPGRMSKYVSCEDELDFADVAGHDHVKRALQIAAAGGHGVLLMGPPGSGKTMLASRLPGILPPLSEKERIQAALVHSVAGESVTAILGGIRPFRSPHHSASTAGLVGGGAPPRPGEISLATGGVLFLDEIAEFKPSVLQAIRQPLESGRVVITRADGGVTFPAKFMLIAAANPCPCGYFGDGEISCSCTGPQIRAYQNRIGGPLMDRIDIHIDVWRSPPSSVLNSGTGVSSAKLREGVMSARAFASRRRCSGDYDGSSSSIIRECSLGDEEENLLKDMARVHHMSGRGIMRTLSIARTIADLAESEVVQRRHLAEAFGLRLREGIGIL